MIYKHIDRTGQLKNLLINQKYIITGKLLNNGFALGFIQNKDKIILNGLNFDNYEKIVALFKSKIILLESDFERLIDSLFSLHNSLNNWHKDYYRKVALEVIFENVRLNNLIFKNLPSRLNCIFLFENSFNVEKLHYSNNINYTEYIFEDCSKYKVPIKIEYLDNIEEKYHVADMSWIETDIQDIKIIEGYAKHYWAGEIKSPKDKEILFYGILKIYNGH